MGLQYVLKDNVIFLEPMTMKLKTATTIITNQEYLVFFQICWNSYFLDKFYSADRLNCEINTTHLNNNTIFG